MLAKSVEMTALATIAPRNSAVRDQEIAVGRRRSSKLGFQDGPKRKGSLQHVEIRVWTVIIHGCQTL